MPDAHDLTAIYTKALDLFDLAERSAYLDLACAGDVELRRRVEQLLASHPSQGQAPVDSNGTIDCGANAPDPEETAEIAGWSEPPPHTVTRDYHTPDTVGVVSPTDPLATITRESVFPTTGVSVRAGAEGIGSVIAGRYRLEGVIGEGGMGSVYLADQSEPVKRQVALKLIKGGVDSKAVLARFEAERQALALMDHPNIARIYDGGLTPAGQPFFAMELVRGMPLTDYCDQKRLDISGRLELFVSVCQAVQHAHRKGIIHRDLKPGNVLVTEVDGRPTPKVIDFGVAKATEQPLTDRSFADVGAIVGTPAYMSPEQADPSSMDIDTRTDVYALGVILYELLVGSPPLEVKQFKRGAVLEMLRMVREVEPPRPSTKLSTAEGLPGIAANRNTEPAELAKVLRGELDWVVMKALEKDRTRRYDSALGLAQDVQRFLADEVVEARPPSRGYRLQKLIRRNRGAVLAATLVFLALVVGIVGTTLGYFEARAQETLAKGETKKKEAALQKAVEEEQKAIAEAAQKEVARAEEEVQRKRAVVNEALANDRLEETQYVAALDQILLAQSAFETGNVTLANSRLDQIPPEFRRWEWHYLRRQFEGGLYSLYGHGGPVESIAYSPDGRRLISVDRTNSAILWDAHTGEKIRPIGADRSEASCCDFSPDGKQVVTGGDRRLTVWDAETGRPQFDLEGKGERVRSVRFSPDGTRLVTGHADASVRLWEVKSGEMLREFPGHVTEVAADFQSVARAFGAKPPDVMVDTDVAFSPDGKQVISGAVQSVKVWDVETGTIRLSLRWKASAIGSVGFTPDGKQLMAASGMPGDSRIQFWDTATGADLREIRSTRWFQGVTLSPDGQSVAVATDTGLQILDFVTGATVREFHGHTSEVRTAAFSPDGSRIATGHPTGVVKVWDAREGTPPRELSLQEGIRPQPVFSALRFRNDTVASANRTAGALLWDTRTGKPRQSLKVTDAVFVGSSPDGSHLVTGERDGSIKLWEASTGKFLDDLPGHKSYVRQLVFTPDGERLLTASEDGLARVLNPESGEVIHTLKHPGPCLWISSGHTGKRLATCAGTQLNSRVYLWDATTGNLLRELTAPTPGMFRVVLFDHDGERVFAANSDGTVYTWETESGALISRLEGHQRNVNGMDFTPDGTRLATCGEDRVARVWDARTGTHLVTMASFTQSATTISFDQRGEWLTAASYDGVIRLFDGRPLPAPIELVGPKRDIWCLAWNNDGSLLATGGIDGDVTVWESATGRQRYTFQAKSLPGQRGRVDSLVFSPDGKHLCVTSDASFITLHDAATGDVERVVVETRDQQFSGTQKVRFSADGKKLFYALPFSSREPIVMDLESGAEVQEPPPPLSPLSTLSPRGDTVALLVGNTVKLVPVSLSDTDRAERRAAAEPRIQFHWNEYQKAIVSRQPYAVAFHRKRLETFGDEYHRMRIEASKQFTGFGLQDLQLGKWDRAVESLEKATEMDPTNQAATKALARGKQVAAEFRSMLFSKGEYLPATTADRLDMISASAERKWYRIAADLSRLALNAEPALADDLKASHRLAAARYAILFGFGKIEENAQADEKLLVEWRTQALAWLKDELTVRKKTAPDTLALWHTEAVLGLTRPGPERIELTPSERAAWDAFWKEVPSSPPVPDEKK